MGCWRGYLSGARCRLIQLMPLPLTVSCFSKIQIGFTFLVPAHPDSPGQSTVKRVCLCVCIGSKALPVHFLFIIIRPHHMLGVQRCDLLLQLWHGLSVCLLVTTVSPTKTDEPIECRLACGLGWSPSVGGPDPPIGRGNLRGVPLRCGLSSKFFGRLFC